MRGKKDLKSIYRIREEKRLKFINLAMRGFIFIYIYIYFVRLLL
jgi:hypothetical protein